ncbi:MAG: hypothetical protein OHK0053_02480 [Microscillaceae bacterium]
MVYIIKTEISMYNKRSAWVLFLGLMFFTSAAFAQIKFTEGDWTSVRQKAQKENKFIMVDAYTTWCGPCKWMAANVFTEAEVGNFYNAKFVSYQLDMEAGEGPEFAQQYRVEAYPTILYFSPSGELVHRSVGAVPGDIFIKNGEAALDPSKQLYQLKKQYEAGDSSPDFLRNYALALNSAYEDATEVANKYLATQAPETWMSAENWEFIQNFAHDINSAPFQYVMKNQAAYEAAFGQEAVGQYVEQVLGNRMYEVAESGDENLLKEMKGLLKQNLPEAAPALIARLEYMFYYSDPEKGFETKKAYLDQYSQDWNELNQIAWETYENESDPKKLESALVWADKSIQLEKNWYNTDTKAHLLFKLKRYTEAQKMAEESISIGKSAGEDTQGTAELLTKIKSARKK